MIATKSRVELPDLYVGIGLHLGRPRCVGGPGRGGPTKSATFCEGPGLYYGLPRMGSKIETPILAGICFRWFPAYVSNEQQKTCTVGSDSYGNRGDGDYGSKGSEGGERYWAFELIAMLEEHEKREKKR